LRSAPVHDLALRCDCGGMHHAIAEFDASETARDRL